MEVKSPENQPRALFSSAQWIAWFGATVLAMVGTTAFAFNTFITRGDADIRRGYFTARLDRLEDKIDIILERESGLPTVPRSAKRRGDSQ